jgi:hypothetical protein
MKPEPPWSWTASSPARIAASSANDTAHAVWSIAARSSPPASQSDAARHTIARAASTSMLRSASVNATAWKWPMGFPKALRCSQ